MKLHGSVLKVYRDLHSWLGISAGLLLYICFIAGSLTMFKPEFNQWAQPTSPQFSALNAAEYDRLLPQVLALAAPHEVTVDFSPDAVAPFSWQPQSSRQFQLDAHQMYAGLAPDGQLQTHSATPSQLGDLIDLLHRTAGIPGIAGHHYWGEIVMGVAAVMYFIALVSGLLLLLPTLRRDLFSVRRSSGKKFWLDSHNLLGLTSLPFHLIISFTVVVFAFHDPIYDHLERWVHPSDSAEQSSPPRATPSSLLPLSTLRQQACAHANGATVSRMRLQLTGPRPLVRVELVTDRHYSRGARQGYLLLHPASGAVLSSAMVPGAQAGYAGMVDLLFASHFGSFGGYGVKWLYCVLGLMGALLFYSGNLLWLESRRHKVSVHHNTDAAPTQPRRVRLLAALTVGVGNGCLLGIAVVLLASKWLPAWVQAVNHSLMWLYYSSFLVVVLWSLRQGAAKSVVPQLYLGALLLLLVPLCSAIASQWPMTGVWPARNVAEVVLEFSLLVLSFVGISAARRMQHRVATAAADSIWSTTPPAIAPGQKNSKNS